MYLASKYQPHIALQLDGQNQSQIRIQSSHPGERVTENLVYRRIEVNRVARNRPMTEWTI